MKFVAIDQSLCHTLKDIHRSDTLFSKPIGKEKKAGKKGIFIKIAISVV